jgi:hypothetical protein
MTDSLEGKSFIQPDNGEAQGRCRELGSEGSMDRSHDPMDKNRLTGLEGEVRALVTEFAVRTTALLRLTPEAPETPRSKVL